MAEEVLDAEAVEELDAGSEVDAGAAQARPLPEPRRDGELQLSGADARTVALAAAGGIVAGAATVAAVRAVRAGATRAARPGRRPGRRPVNVLASRSFLVDVHLLGK